MRSIIFCFLLVFGCPHGVQAATQLSIIVEEQTHPPEVGIFVASIDGSEVAVIPGAFTLTVDTSREYLVQLSNELNYGVSLRLAYDKGELHLDSVSMDCWPVAVQGILNRSAPRTYHLLLTYSTKESACFTSKHDYVAVSPDGYLKMRFDANPSTATVYLRTVFPFSASGLPKIFDIAYREPKTEFTAFFKSAGYLDCLKRISITRQGGLYRIEVNDESPPILTNGNGGDDVRTVSCTLARIQ